MNWLAKTWMANNLVGDKLGLDGDKLGSNGDNLGMVVENLELIGEKTFHCRVISTTSFTDKATPVFIQLIDSEPGTIMYQMKIMHDSCLTG